MEVEDKLDKVEEVQRVYTLASNGEGVEDVEAPISRMFDLLILKNLRLILGICVQSICILDPRIHTRINLIKALIRFC